MIGLIILATIAVIMVSSSILYFKKGYFKRFYHDVIKWHTPNNNLHRFDGCSIHNICKHCSKKIIQDSQGNWFEGGAKNA